MSDFNIIGLSGNYIRNADNSYRARMRIQPAKL